MALLALGGSRWSVLPTVSSSRLWGHEMTEATDASIKDQRMWAMLSHLGGFAGYFFPFGNIVAPLVIWLVKKDQSAFIDRHAKESLNFQIAISIYTLVAAILCIVVIGFVLIIAILIFEIVVIIQAAIAANDGGEYRYPLSIRFIR
ncbi:DUF4870 domain-containing protein [Myxococcota bacterium]